MIKIYHVDVEKVAKDRALLMRVMLGDTDAVIIAWNRGQYDLVAEVDTKDLEVAWRLTNNVETSWSMEPDPRVKLLVSLHVIEGETFGRRSSMVGDIFVLNGEHHVISGVGFTVVPPPWSVLPRG